MTSQNETGFGSHPDYGLRIKPTDFITISSLLPQLQPKTERCAQHTDDSAHSSRLNVVRLVKRSLSEASAVMFVCKWIDWNSPEKCIHKKRTGAGTKSVTVLLLPRLPPGVHLHSVPTSDPTMHSTQPALLQIST